MTLFVTLSADQSLLSCALYSCTKLNSSEMHTFSLSRRPQFSSDHFFFFTSQTEHVQNEIARGVLHEFLTHDNATKQKTMIRIRNLYIDFRSQSYQRTIPLLHLHLYIIDET